jgi:hypothetical protein
MLEVTPTDLDTVLQGLASQIAIDERGTSTDAFECIPQKQVTAAVRPIKSNDFALSNTEIVHQPVADSLHCEIESIVHPELAFKVQKKVIG